MGTRTAGGLEENHAHCSWLHLPSSSASIGKRLPARNEKKRGRVGARTVCYICWGGGGLEPFPTKRPKARFLSIIL